MDFESYEETDGKHPIDYALERLQNFRQLKEIPLDVPYKVEKVLGFELDRKFPRYNIVDAI